MGLLRRKPSAAERAAAATREAAVTASEQVQDVVETATGKVAEAAGEVRVRADRAAEKLSRRAEKARDRAEAAGKRAEKARRKAGKRAATASKRARKAADTVASNAAESVSGGAASIKAAAADRKADLKASRFAAKADAGARKAEAKAQLADTKARAKGEQAALNQAEKERQAREWNAARAKRYLAIGRVLAPVLAPYAMAAAGQLRHRWDDRRSRNLGVSPEELGGYSGRGGQLHARISRISKTFGDMQADGTTERSPQARALVETNEPRLHDFAAAVRAAEQMPAQRRKAAYRAVSNDLDRIEVELLSHLGVDPSKAHPVR